MLQEYWRQLQRRERRVLIAGAVALVLLGGYSLVWEPWQHAVKNREAQVARQRDTLTWMQRAAGEVLWLRKHSQGTNRKRGGSLLAVVDSTARRAGLGKALKRIQPDNDTQVRVWLEDAGFDDTVRWLSQLERHRGIAVAKATIERQDTLGRINARLVLKRGT